MKKAETNYLLYAGENIALYHDRGTPGAGLLSTNEGALIWNPWAAIAKGVNVGNRIGNEIIPRGLALRFLYNAEADRPAQFLRVIVAVVPKTVGATILDGYNFDLLDAGGSNDTVTGMIKKEGVKVLYDKTFTMKTAAERAVIQQGDSRFFKKLYIKSKRNSKIAWQADGNMVNKPVGVWVIPYDRFSTLRSDALGVCSFTYKMYWKDV